jgi:beta-galactosidase/beta-glucuronidase
MRARTYLPRPEYPRPDRQRSFVHGTDWLNLNGPWEFRFDGDRGGVEQGWHLPNGNRWSEQIIVPFCWEALAAWGEADAAGNDNYFSSARISKPRSGHAIQLS